MADNNTTSMTYPWGDDRRFNSYSNYFKRVFGGRIQKISIDAGFTCPNRDGTISRGGCTFCCNDAFNPSYCRSLKSITQQIDEGIAFHSRRYRRAEHYLAYFQPYSNTYKHIDELEKTYAEALRHDKIAGIVVGTRPDLVDDDIIALLQKTQQSHYVMIEYGVESVYDDTLRRVNRGHDFATAQRAIAMTAKAGIPCGAHFIIGLPGESAEMLLHAADLISTLPLTTAKFHQLQIFRDTPMAEQFKQHPEQFHLFGLDEYTDLVIDMAERLSPDIVIERFAGEVPPRYLATSAWTGLRYDEVLRHIENRMKERDTCQGRLFEKTHTFAPRNTNNTR